MIRPETQTMPGVTAKADAHLGGRLDASAAGKR